MTKNILLIITGSVAAYKSVDLIRLFKKADYKITPVMTKGAEEFITPLLVASIAGERVLDQLFSSEDEAKIGHINLSRTSDAIVIAPITADFIAKMAGGFANDLASNIVLAANKPIFIAPAMNEKMWNHPQTQKNLQILRENGVKILEPKADLLACGEYGIGKMVEPAEIFTQLDNFFSKKKIFAGKKVIVTAGATFEAIDPVRFIGNHSSGKQGIAIAESLSDLGAEVILVAGNIKENINLPKQNIIRVVSADQMLKAVEENLESTEIFISTAAVADFKPKKTSTIKIKKSDQNSLKTLELIENVDILKTIATSKRRPKIVVGFAAESCNLIENALVKLTAKNCDFIVANHIENGALFGSNYNEVTILSKDGKTKKLEKMTKKEIAEKLIEDLVTSN
ncbi:MAG: phosphopantothenoylcysteine decarboxylase/phosphopantothenate--cysteine ligase [Rickettsiales bacterium]|jgi:phosphopantothenoylcysteine decarboxylase/phosphopantothenate--cysteine ligase